LVGIGAVFVFGAGAFDMSMSGSVCLTAIVGAKVAMATGSIADMVIACLAISLTLGIIKGLLAAYVDVPFFIVTIVIGALLGALGLLIMGKETVLTMTNIRTIVDMTPVNIGTLGGFYLLGLLLFNYTKIGKSCKLIGGNAVAARQSGINIEANKIIAFLVAALGVSLAAIIILLRTKTASPMTGSTIGIDIMVALVLGGMPLSGGPRSKISAALVGAATITVLNSGLVIMGAGTGTIQIFRGVIFLAVVLIASLSYRTQLLPR
jgi:ribose transport system permease protein